MMRPLNVSMPGMSGVRGSDQEPGRGDQEACPQRLTIGKRHLPNLGIVVQGRPDTAL